MVEHSEWLSVRLRDNLYGSEPGIAGSFIASRIPFSSKVRPGHYLYVVDEYGRIWLGPLDDTVKHSSLVPAGALVRCAGHMTICEDGRIGVNCDSGHYMHYRPMLAREEPYWQSAMMAAIHHAGFVPEVFEPTANRIRFSRSD